MSYGAMKTKNPPGKIRGWVSSLIEPFTTDLQAQPTLRTTHVHMAGTLLTARLLHDLSLHILHSRKGSAPAQFRQPSSEPDRKLRVFRPMTALIRQPGTRPKSARLGVTKIPFARSVGLVANARYGCYAGGAQSEYGPSR